ncbi:MAG TPA: TIGR03118 family protein [Chloroflexota bacterium]
MLATFLLVVAASTVSAQATSAYKQTNLISDVPGTAAITDSHVVNPWGIAASSTSSFWISDNGSGVSTLYNGTGQPFPVGSPLVVTIPPPKGSPAGTTAAPTGVVFNSTSDFSVSQGSASGPAQFLFSTEDGTISGWNANVNRTAAGSVQTLFFTAGIQHESHGLFGSLTTAPGASSASTVPSALPRTGEPVPVAPTILPGFAVLGAGLYLRGSLLGRREDSRESGRRKTTV